jgi:hypothetical protein
MATWRSSSPRRCRPPIGPDVANDILMDVITPPDAGVEAVVRSIEVVAPHAGTQQVEALNAVAGNEEHRSKLRVEILAQLGIRADASVVAGACEEIDDMGARGVPTAARWPQAMGHHVLMQLVALRPTTWTLRRAASSLSPLCLRRSPRSVQHCREHCRARRMIEQRRW